MRWVCVGWELDVEYVFGFFVFLWGEFCLYCKNGNVFRYFVVGRFVA